MTFRRVNSFEASTCVKDNCSVIFNRIWKRTKESLPSQALQTHFSIRSKKNKTNPAFPRSNFDISLDLLCAGISPRWSKQSRTSEIEVF
jgi:hypothetical protein